MITIQNLTVRFGSKTVFDHASFELPDEGVMMLFGPSGVGKTTLLRVLAGMQRMDAGSISGLANRKISFVFQEPRLLEWLTAEQNVSVVSDAETAKGLLERLDLGDERKNPAKTLSGGQKQRVSLARAFAYSTDVVLLDEPFTGLDEENKRLAIDLIRSARLAIVVSHDPNDAERLNACKNIVL